MPTRPPQQIPAVYHRKIGDIVVTSLSDGTLERTNEMMLGGPADEGQRWLGAAFRSTLQETHEADLLLHVIDAHDDNRHAAMEQVNAVLKEIGAEGVPQIEVYNKIDLVPEFTPRVERDEHGRVRRVWVSAVSGAGLELLRAAVAEHVAQRIPVYGGPEQGYNTYYSEPTGSCVGEN